MSLDLDKIIAKFKEAGIDSPRLDAVIIKEFAKDESELDRFTNERLGGKPVCKIVGSKGFYKYDFIVSEDVLSPRPDTEVLVEKAIDIIKENKLENVLEFGVGSGCIISSILADVGWLRGVGVDISSKALNVARRNAELLGVTSKITLLERSWFDNDIKDVLSEKFDMIVSNPPYIPSEDVLQLDKEVREYDPILALDGGTDGLRDYRQIAKVSKEMLVDGGFVLLEVGINQHNEVADIFTKEGFSLVDIIKDLAGIYRCLVLKK